MKYIGHLDLLKIFQSAIRRAKLPIAYSMGFNPHQRLSFALPLPLGVDSVCEYIEILLDEPADLSVLDEQFPEGLRVLSVYEVSEKVQKPAAAVAAVDYRLTFKGAFDETLMDSKEILVIKKSKSGLKEVDIRPDILSLEYDPVGAVNMRLSTLNPHLAAQKLTDSYELVRLELLANKNGDLVPLHKIAL